MNTLAIGVDIGGTRTKYGLVDIDIGRVVQSTVQPTETENAQAFLEQLGAVVQDFSGLAAGAKTTVQGIGIGIPGFTDERGMAVTTYGFLAFMENYPVKQLVENLFSIACRIDNDARIVALGEALYGRGKNFERVLTLTLGTGVGFGLVVNGRFTEPLPLAHMGGHMSILPCGEVCYCGKTGCLEALVSSTGIMRAAAEKKSLQNALSPEAVFNAAGQGNPEAIAVVEQTAAYLHTAIHNYSNLFAPGIIVLGGGIAKGLEPYLAQIKGKYYLAPYPGYAFELAVSALQEQAGMLGSAALFLNRDTK